MAYCESKLYDCNYKMVIVRVFIWIWCEKLEVGMSDYKPYFCTIFIKNKV